MNNRTLLIHAFLLIGGTVCTRPGPLPAQQSSVKVQQLLRDDLAAIAGKEATIQAVELTAGWVGEKHVHTGDMIVYIHDRRFLVDVAGEGEKVF